MIRAYSDRLWTDGCAAPVIKDYIASVNLKPDARPKASRAYKLSEYDSTRLEHRLEEFMDTGQMYEVKAGDEGLWASPAFIVDKKDDILGRVVADYKFPNKESEDHPGVPKDGEEMLRNASGKRYHTCLDMVWGFSQIMLDEKTQRLLTIVTKSGLKRWRY